jgi:hypothetical protein
MSGPENPKIGDRFLDIEGNHVWIYRPTGWDIMWRGESQGVFETYDVLETTRGARLGNQVSATDGDGETYRLSFDQDGHLEINSITDVGYLSVRPRASNLITIVAVPR